MLCMPRILSLFPNSFNKFEHSCKILYIVKDLKLAQIIEPASLLANQSISKHTFWQDKVESEYQFLNLCHANIIDLHDLINYCHQFG